MITAYELRNYI